MLLLQRIEAVTRLVELPGFLRNLIHVQEIRTFLGPYKNLDRSVDLP